MAENADTANAVLSERRAQAEAEQKAKSEWRAAMAARFRPTGRTSRDVEGARCVIRLAEKDDRQGSIYIPDDQRMIATQGVVVASGEGCQFQAGDQVMFSQHVGTWLAFPDGTVDQKHKIVNEFEVFGWWPAETRGEREPAAG